MDIRELCTLYSNAPVADFLSSAWKKGQVCEADNWQGSSVAVAFSSRLPRKGEMRLFVMNDEDEAMALWQDFVSLQGSDNVLHRVLVVHGELHLQHTGLQLRGHGQGVQITISSPLSASFAMETT